MNTPTKLNVTSSQFKADPYPFYALLRAEAPVYRITLPSKQPVWLVTRYDDALTVIKDSRFAKDKYATRSREQLAREPWRPSIVRVLERNMLSLDDPDHKRLRMLVHQAFTPRLIEQMRDQIEALTDKLLDDVQRHGHFDLISDYALPIPTTIIAEMLGVPLADRRKFNRWSNNLVSSTASRFGPLRLLPQVLRFLHFIRSLVRVRQRDPHDDLISMLIQAQEAGERLSEDELVAMIFLLLVAGHETTVNLIGNGTLALLQHPTQWEQLRDEPPLIKPAVEELLRFASPVEWADERYAREDIVLAGTTIPRGELVHAVIASANRDDRQFTNPDTLDITREPNRHLAFGQGIHYCLGAPLARMEGQIAINTLLRRLPELRLAVAPDVLRWRPGVMLRGLQSLPIAFASS